MLAALSLLVYRDVTSQAKDQAVIQREESLGQLQVRVRGWGKEEGGWVGGGQLVGERLAACLPACMIPPICCSDLRPACHLLNPPPPPPPLPLPPPLRRLSRCPWVPTA